MWADAVVALQHREATQRGRDADGGESGVAGGGEGAAVVHRRGDSHAGGHLVVEQSAYTLPQFGGDDAVQFVINAARVTVNTARKIPFQYRRDLPQFLD